MPARVANERSVERAGTETRHHHQTGHRKQQQIHKTSLATRCGMECGMGVPQGVPT